MESVVDYIDQHADAELPSSADREALAKQVWALQTKLRAQLLGHQVGSMLCHWNPTQRILRIKVTCSACGKSGFIALAPLRNGRRDPELADVWAGPVTSSHYGILASRCTATAPAPAPRRGLLASLFRRRR